MRFYDLLLWISSLRWKQHQNAFFTNSLRQERACIWVAGCEPGTQREELCLFSIKCIMRSTHTRQRHQCISFEYFAYVFFCHLSLDCISAAMKDAVTLTLNRTHTNTIFCEYSFFFHSKGETHSNYVAYSLAPHIGGLNATTTATKNTIFSSSLLFGELSKVLTASHSNR